MLYDKNEVVGMDFVNFVSESDIALSQDTIVVKQGDRVKVHFYNLEPVESQEHHTFTINDPAYKIHSDINAGEDTVIEFTASKSGIFDYICTYHQPTMRGELVVLSK